MEYLAPDSQKVANLEGRTWALMSINSNTVPSRFRLISGLTVAVVLALSLLVTPPLCAEQVEGGVISVVYDRPSDSEYLHVAESLSDHGLFDRLAEALSETFLLPEDITLRFTELDEVNAYWDPQNNEITIGYELVHYYSQLFEVDLNDPEALKREYIDAAFFTVLHEVGHAFVTLLELPVTGREEDAVDEFATILLLQMDDEQAESALVSAIEQFAADSEEAEIDESAYADEHSLDRQRYYAILYLIHGSNPEAYQYLVDEGLISEEKAEYTADEYQRKCEAWDRLLSPHIRP